MFIFKASMCLSKLMAFTKTTWSAWEGPDSEDVKAFENVTWHKLKLKSMIGTLGTLPKTYLEVSLGIYYWEVCHTSKKNLS